MIIIKDCRFPACPCGHSCILNRMTSKDTLFLISKDT